MTGDTERIIVTLRSMAWMRAQGELRSLLYTYWPEYDPKGGQPIDKGYDALNKLVRKFVDDVDELLS